MNKKGFALYIDSMLVLIMLLGTFYEISVMSRNQNTASWTDSLDQDRLNDVTMIIYNEKDYLITDIPTMQAKLDIYSQGQYQLAVQITKINANKTINYTYQTKTPPINKNVMIDKKTVPIIENNNITSSIDYKLYLWR